MKLNKKEIIIATAGVLAGLLIFFLLSLFTGSTHNEHSTVVQEQENQNQIWTCSMHPQIRQNEPGKCPICGMDLISLTTGSGTTGHSPFIHTMSPEAAALANIQTTEVSYTTPEYEVYLTGKVTANESNLTVITADFAGRIEKLFVDFTGQYVKKGEKLATIYSPELVTAQKELLEASKSKHINPSLYNAVREKLRLWKITGEQIDRIESEGEVMAEFDVYAHLSGTVISRNVSTGDYVNKGNVLFELADLSTVWIMLDAYESDLPWIATGSKISFSVASIPGKEFTSTVTFIDPVINPQTRTVNVRAEAGNPGLVLKPEMFVKANLKSGLKVPEEVNTKNGKSLVVPKTSVLWTGTRSVVYVQVPETDFPSFEMREVNLGPRAGNFYLVKAGLLEGEEIVTNGVFAIDAAAQLSGNYSMMNRPESKRVNVPEDFRLQLNTAAQNYFRLKEALVNDNYKNAKVNADKLLQSLKGVNMSILDEKAHQEWMELNKHLKESAGQISRSKDINEQRIHFEKLSEAVIESAETFGLKNDMVYVQFCPMAFNDEGAYWLSESNEILNPYFGDEMLTCGEVKKKISPVNSYIEPEDKLRQPVEHQH